MVISFQSENLVTNNKESVKLSLCLYTDAQKIIDYCNLVAGESDNLTFGAGEFSKTIEEEEKIIRSTHEKNNGLFLKAEIENNIVGLLTIQRGIRARLSHSAEFGVSVLAAYQGNGIGKKLIEMAIAWAKKNNLRKLNLTVRTDNFKAIALYKSLGFIEEGIITRGFFIGDSFFDLLQMGLLLD